MNDAGVQAGGCKWSLPSIQRIRVEPATRRAVATWKKKMYGVSINVVIYCECVGIPIIHVIRQRAHATTAIMHTEKAMPVCDITWQGFIQDFLLGEETIDHR